MDHRIKPLDGLRALAALGVIWIHTWRTFGNPGLLLFSVDMYKLMAIAGNGVDFFFVISGFCMYLITKNTLLDTKSYMHFLYKRFLRIAPAFYASVLVYGLLVKLNDHHFSFWYNIFFHALFLNNVVTGNTISGPFWSIGTEWHFYMVLPLLVYLSVKATLPKMLLLFSFFSIVLFCFVNKGYLNYGWWEFQIMVRFPEFAAGILAAFYYLKEKRLPRFFSGIAGLITGLVIMYAGRGMKFTPVLSAAGSRAFLLKSLADVVMTAGFALVLFHVVTVHSFFSKWLSRKWINYLGRISYSIYLWHSLSIIILSPLLHQLNFGSLNVVIAFILILSLTVVISHFSYQWLEAFYFKRNQKSLLVLSQ